MTTIAEASEALMVALRTVEYNGRAVKAYSDPGATIDPIATVLSPPALTWEGLSTTPTSAQFLVSVVVPVDEHAISRLFALVPIVAAAVDTVTDAVVLRAEPGAYETGGHPLPAYVIEIEVSL